MNILLIHQAYVAPGEPGGTRHHELARHCVEQGHQFTIVGSRTVYMSGGDALKSEGTTDGVRVLRAYAFPVHNRGFVWRVLAFLSFMITSVWKGLRSGPVDLVIGTSPSLFQALSASFVAFLKRRPFLLEVRDLWPDFAIDMGVLKNPILIKMSRWLERFVYYRANHILVNSPAYRDYLIGRGIPESKVSLIANGVDLNMFVRTDPGAVRCEMRRRLGIEDKWVVTYTGALGLANDIDTILRAANRLRDDPDVLFLFVGDGKERQHLEDMAEELALENVMFAGAWPKNEIPDVLAASDACLATLKNIPMFKTTYPNKVFDYMAAARPTILGIDGVIRDVVESAEGGVFVPPGDDAAIADAIRKLRANPEQASAMGEAAKIYVAEHFDRQDQAEDFVVLAGQVAQKRAA